MEPLGENEFSASGTGFTIENGNAKLTSVKITVAQKEVTVKPDDNQKCKVSETLPTLTFTPATNTETNIGSEKYNYSGTLSLKNYTNTDTKGAYTIQQGTLAFADGTGENTAFKAANYKLVFSNEEVKFLVLQDISTDDNVTITVGASDLTYNGQLQDPNVTVSDLTDGDYTLSIEGAEEGKVKNARNYTVTVTGNEEKFYTGTKTTTFTVKAKPITAAKAKDQTVTLGKVDEEFDKTANTNTVELTGVIESETPAFDASNSELTLASDDYSMAKTYEKVISISKLKLADNTEGNFLASNYDISSLTYTEDVTKGNLIIKADEDIDIDFPTDDDSGIKVDTDGNGTMVYNGLSPEDIKLTVSIDGEESPLEATDYTVEYKNAEGTTVSDSEILNVGTYTITITITKDGNEHNGSQATKKLEVTTRPLTVTILPQTIEADATGITTTISDETVTVSGEVEGETAVFSTESSLKSTPTSFTPGTVYEDAITQGSTFTLADGTEGNNFKAANYSLPTSIEPADLTVKQSINGGTDPVDPTDPNDEENPIILPGDNDGNDWTWDATSKGFWVTYNGEDHEISTLKVKLTDSESGESTYKELESGDFEVSYSPNKPHDADDYTATIEIKENDLIKAGTYKINLKVVPREMQVDFILPSTIESIAPLAIINSRVKYEAQSGIRGLLTKEQYPDIESGQFIFGKPNAEGLCKVTIQNFILATSTSGFKPSNYQLQIWDAEEGKYVDYNNQGGDITIIDPENPDENNPNNPGGSDSGVVVDPDGDDDNNDHGHGGNTPGGDGKVDYYNMYVDTAATCDGVELSFSKNVVPEGNQVNVYVDKILEGYNADDMKLWFKRSLYGYWEELEEGVQPGEYIIYNVYTDIYVKVTDVKKEDATGIEDVEGAKVYTQDGSLYVYTPSRLPVWIISMTGAVVRNEEQIGLQQYDRLNRGIYIVRVGEQVFKIRL